MNTLNVGSDALDAALSQQSSGKKTSVKLKKHQTLTKTDLSFSPIVTKHTSKYMIRKRTACFFWFCFFFLFCFLFLFSFYLYSLLEIFGICCFNLFEFFLCAYGDNRPKIFADSTPASDNRTSS